MLLLFDYDGTLTPIAPRPDLAQLVPEAQDLLRDLASGGKYTVGVISGRSLADVRVRVDVGGLVYAGNHGLEISGPGIEFVHPEAVALKSLLQVIDRQMKESLARFPGVIIENKGLTLSVHYRLVSEEEEVEAVETAFWSVTEQYCRSGQVKATSGKKVLEVRPNVDWDKGKAVDKLREVYPQAALSVYFGDDLTDEDAFKAVQEVGGMAVFVGPPRQPTAATYRLDSPADVLVTLRLLNAG